MEYSYPYPEQDRGYPYSKFCGGGTCILYSCSKSCLRRVCPGRRGVGRGVKRTPCTGQLHPTHSTLGQDRGYSPFGTGQSAKTLSTFWTSTKRQCPTSNNAVDPPIIRIIYLQVSRMHVSQHRRQYYFSWISEFTGDLCTNYMLSMNKLWFIQKSDLSLLENWISFFQIK